MSLRRIISSVMAMVMTMSCLVAVNVVSVSAATTSNVLSLASWGRVNSSSLSSETSNKLFANLTENNVPDNVEYLVGAVSVNNPEASIDTTTNESDIVMVGFAVIPEAYLAIDTISNYFSNGLINGLIDRINGAIYGDDVAVVILEDEALYEAVYDFTEGADSETGEYAVLSGTSVEDDNYYMLSFADLDDTGLFGITRRYYVLPFTVTNDGYYFDSAVNTFSNNPTFGNLLRLSGYIKSFN